MKRFAFWVFVPGLAYTLFVRPQMLKWGTRLGESQRRLPGDELVPNPNIRATRAVDIHAPPAKVWPWLAQMGRDRTGWYGIDALENAGIPSAAYIRSDLPPPEVGMRTDMGLEIFRLEPGRLVVFGGFGVPAFGMDMDFTLTYLLERRQGERSRLLVRMRGQVRSTVGLLLYRLLFEPVAFLNGRQQLLNLRARAEN